jgi:hypothetical protein
VLIQAPIFCSNNIHQKRFLFQHVYEPMSSNSNSPPLSVKTRWKQAWSLFQDLRLLSNLAITGKTCVMNAGFSFLISLVLDVLNFLSANSIFQNVYNEHLHRGLPTWCSYAYVFFISNIISLKRAEGRNSSTKEVYKNAHN